MLLKSKHSSKIIPANQFQSSATMFYKLFLLASMAALINHGFCDTTGSSTIKNNSNGSNTGMTTKMAAVNNDNKTTTMLDKTTIEPVPNNGATKEPMPDNGTATKQPDSTKLPYCFQSTDPAFKHYIIPGFVGFGSVLGTAFLIGAICNFCAYCRSDKRGTGDGSLRKKQQSKKKQKFDGKMKAGPKKNQPHVAGPMKHQTPGVNSMKHQAPGAGSMKQQGPGVNSMKHQAPGAGSMKHQGPVKAQGMAKV